MDVEGITLSSYTPNLLTGERQNPSNFTTHFSEPIVLDPNSKYGVALCRYSVPFTWYNVNAKRNNQLIRYSSDSGKTFHDITFPAGVWENITINNHIQNETVIKATNKGEKDTYPISLTFNTATFRVLITLKENYQLDLTQSNFNDLIGFDKKILKDKMNIGPKVPNISQDTEIINIHCDLTSKSRVDGRDTNIIYSFSSATKKPSYSISDEPIEKIYCPVNKNKINSIRIYATDGKRRILNLNDNDTLFQILLKRIS